MPLIEALEKYFPQNVYNKSLASKTPLIRQLK